MKFLTKITLSEWKKSVVISYGRCGTLRATQMNLPKSNIFWAYYEDSKR